jgi:hypothetical protein
MKLTERPRAGSRSLFGTCDLVMVHGEVPLDEELLVVSIEDSRADVLAGEGLNGFPGVPEAHRDELGTVALGPPEQPGPAVARRALVAFDSGPLHVRRICGSILRPDRTAPEFSQSSATTVRRYQLITKPSRCIPRRQESLETDSA